MAKLIETQLLDSGWNVDVTVGGPQNRRMTIRNALADKVMAHQITRYNQDMLRNLREMGFHKLVLTDGYDYSSEWNLKQ